MSKSRNRLGKLERLTLVLFVAVVLNSVLEYTIGYQIYGGGLLAVLLAVLLLVILVRSLHSRLTIRSRQ